MIDTVPPAWLEDIVDEHAFLCEWDVDWIDHYNGCIEAAMAHVIYGDPKEFLQLKKDLKGTGVFRND